MIGFNTFENNIHGQPILLQPVPLCADGNSSTNGAEITDNNNPNKCNQPNKSINCNNFMSIVYERRERNRASAKRSRDKKRAAMSEMKRELSIARHELEMSRGEVNRLQLHAASRDGNLERNLSQLTNVLQETQRDLYLARHEIEVSKREMDRLRAHAATVDKECQRLRCELADAIVELKRLKTSKSVETCEGLLQGWLKAIEVEAHFCNIH